MSEHERNFSTVCTRQLKDARNERREFTRNAWILCSVNEPPLQLYPCPSLPVRKTRPIGFIFVPPAFSTRVEKKEFACVPTFRAVWNFSTSGRKRPRESLEDISVRSRASGLRNDRWARVLSRVTEKVSFFLPFLGGYVKSFSTFFVIQVSLSVTFFFPSMIDEIIIIIIVATRVYKSLELFDNNFNYGDIQNPFRNVNIHMDRLGKVA